MPKIWTITDSKRCNVETTAAEVIAEHPDLVASDASGFDVDPADQDTWTSDRILFWANEDEADNDDGSRAVAEALKTVEDETSDNYYICPECRSTDLDYLYSDDEFYRIHCGNCDHEWWSKTPEED